MPVRRTFRKKTSFRPRGKRPRSYPRKPIKQLIQRAIRNTQEVKQFQFGTSQISLVTYSNTANFNNKNVIELGPSSSNDLTQGTGNSNRIGNDISIKSVSLKMIIYPNAYDATINSQPVPMNVRYVIAHSKATPTDLIVSNTFFESNNSTVSPQDNLEDQILNINKDIYVVSRDKSFKVGSANNTGSGSQSQWQHYANNDYKRNVVIKSDITKCFPKKITWNDTSSIPTSFMPNLILFVSRSDGIAYASNQEPLKYFYEVTIRYTDA